MGENVCLELVFLSRLMQSNVSIDQTLSQRKYREFLELRIVIQVLRLLNITLTWWRLWRQIAQENSSKGSEVLSLKLKGRRWTVVKMSWAALFISKNRENIHISILEIYTINKFIDSLIGSPRPRVSDEFISFFSRQYISLTVWN